MMKDDLKDEVDHDPIFFSVLSLTLRIRMVPVTDIYKDTPYDGDGSLGCVHRRF